jgi:hypothetical protein
MFQTQTLPTFLQPSKTLPGRDIKAERAWIPIEYDTLVIIIMLSPEISSQE